MTLKRFEDLLKQIDKDFNIRQRGYGDVAAIYHKNKYILRLNKGELGLNTVYREGEETRRRGRYHAVQLLHRYEWIKPVHRKQLIWGINQKSA